MAQVGLCSRVRMHVVICPVEARCCHISARAQALRKVQKCPEARPSAWRTRDGQRRDLTDFERRAGSL